MHAGRSCTGACPKHLLQPAVYQRLDVRVACVSCFYLAMQTQDRSVPDCTQSKVVPTRGQRGAVDSLQPKEQYKLSQIIAPLAAGSSPLSFCLRGPLRRAGAWMTIAAGGTLGKAFPAGERKLFCKTTKNTKTLNTKTHFYGGGAFLSEGRNRSCDS